MTERRIRVLFLPRWYPNRYDPMPGLFIQRQAEAIAAACDVAVVYLHPEPAGGQGTGGDFRIEQDVRVLRVYYRHGSLLPGIAGKMVDFYRYRKAFRKALHSIRDFRPDIVHAHILTRTGWMAMQAARKMGVPLVISEHWSRYLPENGTYRGGIRKLLTRRVVETAEAVVAVSALLKKAMESQGLTNPRFRVIPNVVEMKQGIPAKRTETEKKVMVHISCFEDKSKNISGFLRSVKALYGMRQDFICRMVGEGPDWQAMTAYAAGLGLPEGVVEFTGLMTGVEFTEALCNADFSVLSSRYETFATVIIESLACGVPVVATSVGVAPEVINQRNGLLVPPGDETAMTDALNRMLDDSDCFDRGLIRAGLGDRFTKEAVGHQLVELYRELLGTEIQ